MESKTLDEKMKIYSKVERANERALKSMRGLKEAFEKGDYAETFKFYNLIFRNVYWMGANYRDLGKEVPYLRFCSVLNDIEGNTGDSLQSAFIQRGFGNNPEIDLFSLVENLGYDERNAGYDNFSSCSTFHDLIRCLHCSSLNALFSGKDLTEKTETFNFDTGSFSVLRTKEANSNSDILESFLSLYKKGVEKKGSEAYRIVMTKKRLVSRVKLGCHLSYLDINLDGHQGDLFVRFVNTSEKQYKYANFRAEYVRKLFEKMGFGDIYDLGTSILATKSGVERKEIPRGVNELVRLFASTRDLDICESIEGRVDDAVGAFMKGKTNIVAYLGGN